MMPIPNWYDYAVFYPEEDEPDFDGVHYGGLKGVRDDAPQEIKDAYTQYLKDEAKAKDEGIICYL